MDCGWYTVAENEKQHEAKKPNRPRSAPYLAATLLDLGLDPFLMRSRKLDLLRSARRASLLARPALLLDADDAAEDALAAPLAALCLASTSSRSSSVVVCAARMALNSLNGATLRVAIGGCFVVAAQLLRF